MPEHKYACYYSISLTKSLGGDTDHLVECCVQCDADAGMTPPPSIPQDSKGLFSQLQFTVHSPLWCLYSLCVQ